MSYLDTESTIVAITTPIGVGGVSIVRLSGKESVAIADKLFVSSNGKLPRTFRKRELVFGTFSDKKIKEKCLLVVFASPNSFTGEDIVEFQCHGGIKICQSILSACLNNGAVIAKNGEFSQRAFLNGKMSLDEAEGMIDMINSETESEINAGYNLLTGKLKSKVVDLQNILVDIMSDIEVSFDYPEEDIEYQTKSQIKVKLTEIQSQLITLIKSYGLGSTIKSGINVVIVGKPNVGKSSLLNALIGTKKAIVTSEAGTTRDALEDSFVVNGVKIRIVDTAGIRKAENKVEKVGVELAKKQLKSADLVLFVVDSSNKLNEEDNKIFDLVKTKKYLVVLNKSDKVNKIDYKDKNAIQISAKNENGIEQLKQAIYDKVISSKISGDSLFVTNERHVNCLKESEKSIGVALKSIDKETLDLVMVDLSTAYQKLGEITGTTTNEKILDSIFSKFCLGK